MLMEPNAGYNEKRLLSLASLGEKSAFSTLFYAHKDKLYGFVLKLTGSRQMAEDVVQDVFCRLWQNRSSLADIEQFSSYIFRMAQNQCISAFRRMAKEVLIVMEVNKSHPAAIDPEQYVAEKELQQKLNEVLAKLPYQQKQVYTLSREQGLKYEEIARQLNISPSTVKNHMIAALKTLRTAFNAHPDTLGAILLFIIIAASFEK